MTGWGYGNDHFSVCGIELAHKYFHKRLAHDSRTFSIVTFIPSKYIRKKPVYNTSSRCYSNPMMETDDVDRLSDMMMKGLITLVPSGDNDDVYILAYARENHGYIVSNDLYADHVRGINNISTKHAVRAWIEEYRCGYAFVGTDTDKEFMINPGSALYDVMNNGPMNIKYHDSVFQFSHPLHGKDLNISDPDNY
jgi:Zc3h12a-like Ribonuclease NYN domain